MLAGLSIADFCVSEHTFDREDITGARLTMEETQKPVASFTVSSPPLAGLSMALMQLVREFSARPDTKVWWIVGDAQASEKALSLMSEKSAAAWFEELRAATPRIRRAVILIDDFWKVPNEEKKKFRLFARACKDAASGPDDRRLLFVLGSVGAASRWSWDGEFNLKLTKADKQRCYQKMAIDSPCVLGHVAGGLDVILGAHPLARWYEHDAPAFIDYLMENGRPTGRAKAQWLAQIQGLSSDERDIVTRTSVAQLIGLSVEEKIALSLFCTPSGGKFTHVEHLANIRHLQLVTSNWRGVGVGSARRARDILIRAALFEESFIKESLSQFLDAAIERMKLDGIAAAPAADFARHIFQRLLKDELYQFPNKLQIGKQLLFEHVVPLRTALAAQDSATHARWAGTLSPIRWNDQDQTPSNLAAAVHVPNLLCDLCENVIEQLQQNPALLQPETLVGLYRACRRMAKTSPEATERAESVRVSLRACVTDDVFWRAFGMEFNRSDENAEYRCNELIHARLTFEDGFTPDDKFAFYQRMTDLLAKAETELRSKNFGLDAANWLMRAKYVWRPFRNAAKLETALAKQADCLAQAKRCVTANPETQGTWSKKVNDAIKAFLKLKLRSGSSYA